MSSQKGQSVLLESIGNTTVALVALVLTLPARPAWADGVDVLGRSVYLVGRHNLGDGEGPRAWVQMVLEMMERTGEAPDSVQPLVFAPVASEAVQAAMEGPADSADVARWRNNEIVFQLALRGPRKTGKSKVAEAVWPAKAEQHARAGFPLPYKVLCLQDVLKSFADRTGASLEEPLWGGLWTLRNDRSEAVLTLAGVRLVEITAVGTQDQVAKERARNQCHGVWAEELAPAQGSGGIDKDTYEIALSSARMPGLPALALSTMNGYDPDHWAHARFQEAGGQPCTREIVVPLHDRLTAAEQAALLAAFTDPVLAAKLGRGECVPDVLGDPVATGFRHERHVAPTPLTPVQGWPLVLGHDAGLTPVTIIGQDVRGEIRVYASLASDRAGTRQHLEALVLPWLAAHAPWVRGVSSHLISHYDPAMDTPDQSNVESSPATVLREVLGSASYPGPVSWPGRRDPLLTLLTRLNPLSDRARLQVDPEGCRLLISALTGRWIYPTVNGKVSRELPLKNHPWSDLGDAFCYFVAGVTASAPVEDKPIKVDSTFDLNTLGAGIGPSSFRL